MLWHELSRIALLGTERSSFSEELETHLLDLGISEELSPAQQLLEAAAFLTQYRKVQAPKAAKKILASTTKAASQVQYVSSKSVQHLDTILEKKMLQVLAEFSYTMQVVGKVFPPESLPKLLDLSVTDTEIWTAIGANIGERAWWLLRQHPKWKQLAQQPHTAPPIAPKKVRASMTFVQQLKQSLSSSPLLVNQQHRQQLLDAAFYSDLNKYDSLRDGWYLNYQFSHNWTQDVEQFLRILGFRKAMVAALEKE